VPATTSADFQRLACCSGPHVAMSVATQKAGADPVGLRMVLEIEPLPVRVERDLDRRVSHLLLQPFRVAAVEDVGHGEGMAHRMWTESTICEPRQLEHPLEIPLHVALAVRRAVRGGEHPGRNWPPPPLDGVSLAVGLDRVEERAQVAPNIHVPTAKLALWTGWLRIA